MERYRPTTAIAVPATTAEPSPFSGSTEVRLLKQLIGDIAARLAELDATFAPEGSYQLQELDFERRELLIRQTTARRKLDAILNPPPLSPSQVRARDRRESAKRAQIAQRRQQLDRAIADAEARGEHRQARLYRHQKLDAPFEIAAEWEL